MHPDAVRANPTDGELDPHDRLNATGCASPTHENIPPREGRSVTVGGERIAIFNLSGRFLTIENQCPHKGGPLCDGIVSGTRVVCPLHGWRFDLETGMAVRASLPASPRSRRAWKTASSSSMLAAAASNREESSRSGPHSASMSEATSSAERMQTGIPVLEMSPRRSQFHFEQSRRTDSHEHSQQSHQHSPGGFLQRAHARVPHVVDRVLSVFFWMVRRRAADAGDPRRNCI